MVPRPSLTTLPRSARGPASPRRSSFGRLIGRPGCLSPGRGAASTQNAGLLQQCENWIAAICGIAGDGIGVVLLGWPRGRPQERCSQVRGLLLPQEDALRARPRGAVLNLSPQPPRRARAPEATGAVAEAATVGRRPADHRWWPERVGARDAGRQAGGLAGRRLSRALFSESGLPGNRREDGIRAGGITFSR